MNHYLRSPRPEEAATVARISAQCYPERPEHPDQWAGVTAEQPYWVLVAPETDQVIGYGAVRPEPGTPPEASIWRLCLGVEPEHRRQGGGEALLERLLTALRERGGKAARIRLRHTSAEALDLLRKRGFAPFQEMLHLVQELAELPALTPMALPGIRFTTLEEELASNPEAVAQLHGLYATAIQAIPTGQENSPPPLEAFRRYLLESPVLPASCWIALAADRQVGATWAAAHPADPTVLSQHFTGVLPGFRGQGIARALKQRVTHYALAHGYRRVTTATLTANLSMRAVNERLGFRIAYSELRLQRPL